MYFVVCFREVVLKLRGLMASEPVAAIKEGCIIKEVLAVGVLAFVFFKELIDDDFALPGWMVRSGLQVQVKVHWLLIGRGSDPSFLS